MLIVSDETEMVWEGSIMAYQGISAGLSKTSLRLADHQTMI
jgi:hypothetical protein